MNNLHRVIKNTRTNEQFVIAKPTDKERLLYDKSMLVSETNIQGIITYANRRFQTLSGYTRDELIGSPHNILRHPDIPKGLFKAMWKIIAEKKIWRGYVKSLAKDGSYYWTLSYIQAKVNDKGDITGYTATRRIAYPESILEVEAKYAALMGDEHIDHEYFMSGELYHGVDLATRA